MFLKVNSEEFFPHNIFLKIFNIYFKIMSTVKLRHIIRKIISENSQEMTLPFDEEIKNKLNNLFLSTSSERIINPEQRTEQLMQIHSKWLEIAKKNYSADEIAQKLYTYARNLNKPVQEQ